MRIVDRIAPRKSEAAGQAAVPPISKALPGDIPEAPPRAKAAPIIKLVAGVIENDFLLAEDLQRVSRLPTLHTLQAQVVGLLSAPASKLAGLLHSAVGGSLLRTLQGYEKGLAEIQSSKTV
jgi:hypothetical protein